MPVAVSIFLLGDEVFADYLEDVGDRGVSLEPVMESVVSKVIDWTEDQFSSEGARSGNPWEQLARDTVLRRKYAHPILIRDASLLIESTTEANFTATDDGFELDMPEEQDRIGSYHQHGTTKMPARPIFDFTPLDREVITEMISDFLARGRSSLGGLRQDSAGRWRDAMGRFTKGPS